MGALWRREDKIPNEKSVHALSRLRSGHLRNELKFLSVRENRDDIGNRDQRQALNHFC